MNEAFRGGLRSIGSGIFNIHSSHLAYPPSLRVLPTRHRGGFISSAATTIFAPDAVPIRACVCVCIGIGCGSCGGGAIGSGINLDDWGEGRDRRRATCRKHAEISLALIPTAATAAATFSRPEEGELEEVHFLPPVHFQNRALSLT